MRICSRCKIEKDDSEFRKRVDKRNGGSSYQNNYCKQCDKELSKAYYDKRKDDPEFRKKNAERVKAHNLKNVDKIKLRRSTVEYLKKHAQWELRRYHKSKDIVAIKMKIRRQTAEYKKMMRDYREKNKDKIYHQEQITKRRYQKKNMEAITDKYVLGRLGISIAEWESIKHIMPDLIEFKRDQIKLYREIHRYN